MIGPPETADRLVHHGETREETSPNGAKEVGFPARRPVGQWLGRRARREPTQQLRPPPLLFLSGFPEHPITIDEGSRVVHDADMAMGKREGDEAA